MYVHVYNILTVKHKFLLIKQTIERSPWSPFLNATEIPVWSAPGLINKLFNSVYFIILSSKFKDIWDEEQDLIAQNKAQMTNQSHVTY